MRIRRIVRCELGLTHLVYDWETSLEAGGPVRGQPFLWTWCGRSFFLAQGQYLKNTRSDAVPTCLLCHKVEPGPWTTYKQPKGRIG